MDVAPFDLGLLILPAALISLLPMSWGSWVMLQAVLMAVLAFSVEPAPSRELDWMSVASHSLSRASLRAIGSSPWPLA